MRSKLLKIKLERFQSKKPLAREIFLAMPLNGKMLRVVAPGDELRTGFLQRLPENGVEALYARPLEGEPHSPDTYPIYVEPGQLNEVPAQEAKPQVEQQRSPPTKSKTQAKKADPVREELSVNVYPELASQEIRSVKGRAKERTKETVFSGDKESWEQVAERFSQELTPDVLKRLAGDFQVKNLSFHAPGETAEPEDRFFPRDVIESHRKLDQQSQFPGKNGKEKGEREDTLWNREVGGDVSKQGIESSGDPVEAAVLGDVLVKTVREFASNGDHYRSHELKAIAGALARCAQDFFNSGRCRDAYSESAQRVLMELKEIRRELKILTTRDGYIGNEQLSASVEQAIRAFRRGVKKAA